MSALIFAGFITFLNCVSVSVSGKLSLRLSSLLHYDDVIMGTIASQITSLTSVYSTVYSGADQSKHQSSASLAFVWGIHRDRWIPRTNGQLRGKCFHSMTSSWSLELSIWRKVCLIFYQNVWTLNPSWKRNHIKYKVWSGVIYPIPTSTATQLKLGMD